jgi:hypothetical protein
MSNVREKINNFLVLKKQAKKEIIEILSLTNRKFSLYELFMLTSDVIRLDINTSLLNVMDKAIKELEKEKIVIKSKMTSECFYYTLVTPLVKTSENPMEEVKKD